MNSQEKQLLGAEAKERLEKVGKADILVGIPSYQNEKTIAHVTRAVMFGLAKYFPKHKSVLMNSDGGSTDRTREIFKETTVYGELDTLMVDHPVKPASTVAVPYHGIPGKGSAFRAIFEAAKNLGVKACVVVDSDLRSITPEWIEMLAGPIILKGYDYVAPYYFRHKYDATITNSIVYPLTRALYGRRVRQPIGGDFGFSGRLAKFYLSQDVWGTDVGRFGIDVWMTTSAINEGYKLCQAYLGAKIHNPKDPKGLGPMFKQVVGTIFKLMIQYETQWKEIKGSSPTALYGFRSDVSPEPVKVNPTALIQGFRDGLKKYKELWSAFLTPEDIKQLEKTANLDEKRYRFPHDLWIKCIYDFAVGYKEKAGKGNKAGEMVASLVPIYFGRTASFCLETENVPTYEAEETIEKLCDKFEELKPYLVKRWDAPEE